MDPNDLSHEDLVAVANAAQLGFQTPDGHAFRLNCGTGDWEHREVEPVGNANAEENEPADPPAPPSYLGAATPLTGTGRLTDADDALVAPTLNFGTGDDADATRRQLVANRTVGAAGAAGANQAPAFGYPADPSGEDLIAPVINFRDGGSLYPLVR